MPSFSKVERDEQPKKQSGSGVHARPLRVGDRIDGKYVVHRTLGAGGWAVVYEAEHVVMKHRVAIKVLRPDEDEQAYALERFKREARLSASIRHPNVLEVYDVGNLDDGSPYLVMELLRGEDLDTRLASGPLHVAEVIDVAVQLTAALGALSEAGIVHRDIKPHNLFLHEADDGSLVLKLLDFGIAKQEEAMCQAASRLTTKGELLGTPHYMAPEQLKNEHVDSRTDLYAVSVVLYELLTGVTPFDELTQGALIASVLRDEVPSLHDRRPDCPEELAQLIYRGLDKDITKRWPSPLAMQTELCRIRKVLGLPEDADAWSPAARMLGGYVVREERISRLSTLAAPTSEPTLDQIAPDTPMAWWRRILVTAAAAVAVTLPLIAWSPTEAYSEEHGKKAAIAKVKVAVAETETETETETATDHGSRIADRGSRVTDREPQTAERESRDATRGVRAVRSEPRSDAPARAAAPRAPAASVDELRTRALAAYVRGQLSQARVLFRRAVAADRNDAESWRGLGTVAAAMGRTDEARNAFRRYLHLSPSAADAPQVRARLAAL